jgi:DNA polymerase III gamma/tau subunit
MKSYRIAIVLIVALLAFHPRPVVSQQAVEKESAPSSEETSTVEIPKNSSDEKTGDEQPAKKEQSSEREPSSKVLQDMMTAEEFKAAGLEKLSSEELKNLNAWLQGYREAAETKAAEKATAKAAKMARLEQTLSRVDGTFTGLTGRTIIKLQDGTVWKQANIDDRYRAQVTDHPAVFVSRGPFGWKMRIEGTPEFYVNPVRNR